MFKNFYALVTLVTILLLFSCEEHTPPFDGTYTESIRLNQIGYYPEAVKKGVVVGTTKYSDFRVMDETNTKVVMEGKLSEPQNWKLAGEIVRIADFSELRGPGTYHLCVKDVGYSYPFEVKTHVLAPAFLGSVKGLYYQRASMTLEEKFAGKWHRALGHPDDSVQFHPSSGKNSGFMASPRGWYDAGDYGKYVLNGSFPLGQLYTLYEEYPDAILDGDLNIPESGNGQSDYIDELKYEMDWLLSMQDDDGGLFFKLTTKGFEGMIMPEKATKQRYIIGKSTGATLDFAAAAAQAYRVYLSFDPDYAARCLEAAKKAYNWAEKNPDLQFLNPQDVSTGQYGDTDFSAELFWATAELFVSTKDEGYLERLGELPLDFEFITGESWTNYMRYLGMFSLLRNSEEVPEELISKIRTGILATADTLVDKAAELDYFQAIDDFHWGSNSDVLNTAMIMAQAYKLQPENKYLLAVQQSVDYILGNNAMGYSYLTGFGDRTPMFIHHRQSAGDGIAEPVPGLLSGGPNSRMQDAAEVGYPEDPAPMKAWADQEPSYASNEICLNWNAPLTYVLGFLEQESK